MAEVFPRQIAGFLRTTTCTTVEVFLRQCAGFLSTTNTVEVFLRQIAGFLDTTKQNEQRSTRTTKPATRVSRLGRGRQESRYIPVVGAHNHHAAPTWLRFSSGRLPVSSTPQQSTPEYEHHKLLMAEVFLRQVAGFLRTTSSACHSPGRCFPLDANSTASRSKP